MLCLFLLAILIDELFVIVQLMWAQSDLPMRAHFLLITTGSLHIGNSFYSFPTGTAFLGITLKIKLKIVWINSLFSPLWWCDREQRISFLLLPLMKEKEYRNVCKYVLFIKAHKNIKFFLMFIDALRTRGWLACLAITH